MRLALPLLVGAVAVQAVPADKADRKSTCPSAYGPGKHTVDLRVTDPDTGMLWFRSLEVSVPDDMPLETERPSVIQW